MSGDRSRVRGATRAEASSIRSSASIRVKPMKALTFFSFSTATTAADDRIEVLGGTSRRDGTEVRGTAVPRVLLLVRQAPPTPAREPPVDPSAVGPVRPSVRSPRSGRAGSPPTTRRHRRPRRHRSAPAAPTAILNIGTAPSTATPASRPCGKRQEQRDQIRGRDAASSRGRAKQPEGRGEPLVGCPEHHQTARLFARVEGVEMRVPPPASRAACPRPTDRLPPACRDSRRTTGTGSGHRDRCCSSTRACAAAGSSPWGTACRGAPSAHTGTRRDDRWRTR